MMFTVGEKSQIMVRAVAQTWRSPGGAQCCGTAGREGCWIHGEIVGLGVFEGRMMCFPGDSPLSKEREVTNL